MSFTFIQQSSHLPVDTGFTYRNKHRVETSFTKSEIPQINVRDRSSESNAYLILNKMFSDGCITDLFPNAHDKAKSILGNRSWTQFFPSAIKGVLSTLLVSTPFIYGLSSTNARESHEYEKGLTAGLLTGVVLSTLLMLTKTWQKGTLEVPSLTIALERQHRFIKNHGDTFRTNITIAIDELENQIQELRSKIEIGSISGNASVTDAIKETGLNQIRYLNEILEDHKLVQKDFEEIATFQQKLHRKADPVVNEAVEVTEE